MSKSNILLLFGGESSEHEVSLSSARNVYEAMDKDKYDISLCYIDRKGSWWLTEKVNGDIDTSNLSELHAVLGRGSFVTVDGGHEIKPDVIFPMLHGRNGEDGTVQGLAQLLHIPIVGCDVTASGIAMNKLASKQILEANGIAVTPYVPHYDYETTPSFDELELRFSNTLFVKPARAGSSVGVSKVRSQVELEVALAEAHKHDPIALIEQAISGQELEVAVLGTPPNHRVSGVGEIVPGEDFYTYDDKYASDSHAEVNVRANIPDDKREEIRETALKVFQMLDCKGLSRVDFIMDGDGLVRVLEINTLPGFTNISMYPKLWEQEGISYPQLIDELIADALAE